MHNTFNYWIDCIKSGPYACFYHSKRGLCFGFLLMLHASWAQALIFGKEMPSTSVSTVRISIQHEHFLRSIGKWQYYESKCSAVIVGTKPLTLLTAAHCLKEVKVDDDSHLPSITILNAEKIGIHDPFLTKAFYRPFEQVVEDVNLDIAVLVFNAKLDKEIKPVPIAQSFPNNSILLLCGFGHGYLEPELENPRCDEKSILPSIEAFSFVLPQQYKEKDEMLYIKSAAQFGYTHELSHSSQSLVAINRINSKGDYDAQLSMVTEGDSGGPWLIKNQQFEVVAISTLVERFYNKNTYWGFFDRDTPLSDYPYIAYGLKLSGQTVKLFLLFCKSSGADIEFIENRTLTN